MMKKRFLAGFLTLAMLAGLFPISALAALMDDTPTVFTTANSIQYLDSAGNTQTCSSATVVESSTTTWNNSWYVVNGNVPVESRITVSGAVHLILADGCKLTASQGIYVPKGSSLTIYAQSTGANMGRLSATGGAGQAGIGANEGYAGFTNNAGTIIINGGGIEAVGGNCGAGIGGGYYASSGYITINGGVIVAKGGGGTSQAIGHGDSDNGNYDHITKSGGLIIEGTEGKVYGGTSQPAGDFTLPAGTDTTVESGQTLTISNGITATIQGTLKIGGSLVVEGTITGNDITALPGGKFKFGSAPEFTLPQGGTVKSDGTVDIPKDIVEIKTLEQLEAFRDTVNGGNTYAGKTVTLANDIDMSAKYGEGKASWTPIGTCLEVDYEKAPIPFQGSFNGGGHEITGLYVNTSEDEYQGLFGYVGGEGSRVRDLTVSGDVTGRSRVGGIVGFLGRGGTVADCHYSGQVSGNYYTGGVIGYVDADYQTCSSGWGVVRCSNAGDISGKDLYTGGVVGCVDAEKSSNFSVTECYNTGMISGTSAVGGVVGSFDVDDTSNCGVTGCYNIGDISGVYDIGGVIGSVDADGATNCSVTDCHNTGAVSATEFDVGGVIGEFGADDANGCNVTKCYNTGAVSSEGPYADNVGGVVGDFDANNSGMSECYNTGTVSSTGDDVGGVAGELSDGYITSCWNIGQVSGKKYVGGVVGTLSYLKNDHVMKSCYNTGNVSGTTIIGGVTGILYDSKIANCYNTGNVSGSSKAGGLVGDKYNNGGSVTDSYYLNTCGAAGDGESKPTGAFSSGEVAWLLQGGAGGEAANLVWGQALRADSAPVLTANSEKRVYHVAIIGSDGNPAVGYRNSGGPVTIPAGGGIQSGTAPNTTVIVLPNGGEVTPDPDGTVTVPGGSVIQIGNGGPEVELPQGGAIGGNGEIAIPGGGTALVGNNPATTITVSEDGGTIKPKPDGTVDVPGGSTVQTGENGPEITVGPGNGGTIGGNGGVTVPEGGTIQIGKDPATTITVPEGGTVDPQPGGGVDVPGGSIIQTGENGPEVTVGPGNGGTVNGDGSVTVEGGGKVTVEGDPDDTTITLPSGGGTVKPNPDGTVTVPGGSIIQIGSSDPVEVPAGGGAVNPNTGEIKQNVYTVTVNGGTGGGSYAVGATVTITATVPSGQRFTGWTVNSGGVTFANASSATTTFTMPAQAVTVTANFQNNSGGGGGYVPPTYPPVVEQPKEGGGTVSVTPNDPKTGDKVTVKPKPDKGYQVKDINVTDRNGKKVNVWKGGDGNYTFTQPSGKVTIEIEFEPVPLTGLPWVNPFSDVAEGAWYYDAVRFVSEKGLMGGYGGGLFGPNDTLSRAQLAQILFNKEGRPVVNYLLQYGDVPTGAWYTEAVRWATSQGIVSGYGNGKFGPNDNITREQLAVMLWRYSGSPAATNKELHFNDAGEASEWAKEALRWAVENGILNGYGDGRLGPQGLATRAQVAQMLKNFLKR